MSFADPRESTAREDRYALHDMDSDLLLRIYAAGAFPMWDEAHDEIHLFRPDPRAVLDFDGLHVPRRLERTIRTRPFELSTDRAFDEVLEQCHRERSDGCWCSCLLYTSPSPRD